MCICVLAVGDGRMGHPEEAPYDAIHVGAAAPSVPQAVSFESLSYPNLNAIHNT